jgi:hypothetical protein
MCRIEYPGNLRDGVPLPKPFEANLQIITIPLIHEPRLVVHTPIVVLGSSDTGLSFLENLIYVSDYAIDFTDSSHSIY